METWKDLFVNKKYRSGTFLFIGGIFIGWAAATKYCTGKEDWSLFLIPILVFIYTLVAQIDNSKKT